MRQVARKFALSETQTEPQRTEDRGNPSGGVYVAQASLRAFDAEAETMKLRKACVAAAATPIV